MRPIWIIARRELQSFFDSLIAYIILALFLGFSGFFTWLFGADVFLTGQASLRTFFSVAFWTLFFFIPALTMRLFAEEKRSGTIELLLTKAVSDREVVVGKFLAVFILILAALAFTAPYVITIAYLGNLDLGQTLCGYLGLTLMSAMYISIGLYASSLTSNQVVALLASLFIGLFFHVIFDVLASNFTGATGGALSALSAAGHFESIIRGVIDTRDLVYFGSFIAAGLLLSEFSLTQRKVR